MAEVMDGRETERVNDIARGASEWDVSRRLELMHFEAEGMWLAYAWRGGRMLAPMQLPQGILAASQKEAVREAKRRLRKYAGWHCLAFLPVKVIPTVVAARRVEAEAALAGGAALMADGFAWGRILRANGTRVERAVELGVETGLNEQDIRDGHKFEPVAQFDENGKPRKGTIMFRPKKDAAWICRACKGGDHGSHNGRLRDGTLLLPAEEHLDLYDCKTQPDTSEAPSGLVGGCTSGTCGQCIRCWVRYTQCMCRATWPVNDEVNNEPKR